MSSHNTHSNNHTDMSQEPTPSGTATAEPKDDEAITADSFEKSSRRQRLKKLCKSPAVESYEKNVSKEHKDWGTGNRFGGGPYRPLSMTPGAADYYTAKGGTGG